MAKRDLAFEALAEVTNSDWNIHRGELNKSLAQIREMFDDSDEELLIAEIRARASLYRRLWPTMTLSASALAKHWLRVFEESHLQRDVQATNQSAPASDCPTCGGHGFVLYQTRPMKQTFWQARKGINPNRGEIEEYAPCPNCSKVDASYRLHDGKRLTPPDPTKVRDRLAASGAGTS